MPCPICGHPAERKHATGPAPTYCSKGCRRAAETQERLRLYRLGRLVEQALRGVVI